MGSSTSNLAAKVTTLTGLDSVARVYPLYNGTQYVLFYPKEQQYAHMEINKFEDTCLAKGSANDVLVTQNDIYLLWDGKVTLDGQVLVSANGKFLLCGDMIAVVGYQDIVFVGSGSVPCKNRHKQRCFTGGQVQLSDGKTCALSITSPKKTATCVVSKHTGILQRAISPNGNILEYCNGPKVDRHVMCHSVDSNIVIAGQCERMFWVTNLAFALVTNGVTKLYNTLGQPLFVSDTVSAVENFPIVFVKRTDNSLYAHKIDTAEWCYCGVFTKPAVTVNNTVVCVIDIDNPKTLSMIDFTTADE